MRGTAGDAGWIVVRRDDHGNRYRVGRYGTWEEAREVADGLEARGHKQMYWVESLGEDPALGKPGV
ncbi:SPOR domain-containing protein [Streptomyces sp. BI20]|uniref:SPOR domain-containing protein n=1 Tax=Streptomyces sp. BI20 TaxID=3403460 RepID=UPI003C7357F8